VACKSSILLLKGDIQIVYITPDILTTIKLKCPPWRQPSAIAIARGRRRRLGCSECYAAL